MQQSPGGWGSQGYPPPQGYGPRPEHTFYQDHIVTVTNARAIIYNTTYALSNITSVREWTIPKSKASAVLGVFFFTVSLLLLVAAAFAWAAVIALAGAICLLFYFYLIKDRHFVRLGTASGEADALVSHDPVYVRTVVAALNNAIVHRG